MEHDGCTLHNIIDYDDDCVHFTSLNRSNIAIQTVYRLDYGFSFCVKQSHNFCLDYFLTILLLLLFNVPCGQNGFQYQRNCPHHAALPTVPPNILGKSNRPFDA